MKRKREEDHISKSGGGEKDKTPLWYYLEQDERRMLTVGGSKGDCEPRMKFDY